MALLPILDRVCTRLDQVEVQIVHGIDQREIRIVAVGERDRTDMSFRIEVESRGAGMMLTDVTPHLASTQVPGPEYSEALRPAVWRTESGTASRARRTSLGAYFEKWVEL